MYKYILPILLFVVGLSACHDDATYKIDSTLDTYLQRFLYEGQLRGKSFNVTENGLIIEFGDLEGDVAGRCYYEDPVRIVIDKVYWDKLGNYAEGEALREDVVFHELGHGLLNRGHINDYLENGDWKSMMCGGTVIDDRSWNINYRAIRRSYYLDELFNIKTAAPAWATKTFTAAVTETAIVEDDFSVASAFWKTGDYETYSASVSGGVFTFINKDTDGIFIGRAAAVLSTGNFYLESRVKLEASAADTQVGLMFGNTDNNFPKGNYLNIDNNQRMFMGNSEGYGWYTEVIKSELNVNDYNVLGIRKIGSDIYYYINGNCVYYDQLSIVQSGNSFGFGVSGNTTVSIDYFHIYVSALKNASVFDTSTIEPMKMASFKTHHLNK